MDVLIVAGLVAFIAFFAGYGTCFLFSKKLEGCRTCPAHTGGPTHEER